MGLYDIITIPCPRCGDPYPAQSKSGACELADYTLENAPEDVLADGNRHAPFHCDGCGEEFMIGPNRTVLVRGDWVEAVRRLK